MACVSNTVTLTARVTLDNQVYVARVDQLPIEATGASADEAREELTEVVISWIQAQDVGDALAAALSGAGFSGVNEETEVQLEFVE